jgi:hypothetical protein
MEKITKNKQELEKDFKEKPTEKNLSELVMELSGEIEEIKSRLDKLENKK